MTLTLLLIAVGFCCYRLGYLRAQAEMLEEIGEELRKPPMFDGFWIDGFKTATDAMYRALDKR